MGDFHQYGPITTLHRLHDRPVDELEAELIEFSRAAPLALAMPSLHSELLGEALPEIVRELREVPYLDQIVIGLDEATEAEYRHALEFFAPLPQQPSVIWNDGPRLREIDAWLGGLGLAPGQGGKGRNVWYLFGYLLGTGATGSVAVHDSDILSYERGLPARLLYPVARPDFPYRFCKGYYARVAGGTMHGRVCRLLVTPLLRALREVCAPHPDLEYLDSFRYALAGEFALRRDLIGDLAVPAGWGLEIGLLAEVRRHCEPSQICQTDLADHYDHKHRALTHGAHGLAQMSGDIVLALFRMLAADGQAISGNKVREIATAYQRIALDLMERHNADAVMNGLAHDRGQAVDAVGHFTREIIAGGNRFPDSAKPCLPSWNHVISSAPGALDRLVQAVDADMREFSGSHRTSAIFSPTLSRSAASVSGGSCSSFSDGR